MSKVRIVNADNGNAFYIVFENNADCYAWVSRTEQQLVNKDLYSFDGVCLTCYGQYENAIYMPLYVLRYITLEFEFSL